MPYLNLKIIPNHHFVFEEFRVTATTHQRQDVAPKEHLNYSNSSVSKFCIINLIIINSIAFSITFILVNVIVSIVI